jgi:5-formyltetrahydrofolate cyclo-ligase
VGSDGSQYDTFAMVAPLDPEGVRALGRTMKVELRKSMLMKRTMTPREVRDAASRAIATRLTALAVWQQARSVALFHTLVNKGEVDTGPLDRAARAEGKRVAYPAIEGAGPIGAASMVFRWVDDAAVLEPRGRGFAEPSPNDEEANAIDLIVVPGLAFDPAGQRVGYGAGLYDRTLPRYAGKTVGIAFDFQIVMELPVTDHDVPVSLIVTDKQVLTP